MWRIVFITEGHGGKKCNWKNRHKWKLSIGRSLYLSFRLLFLWELCSVLAAIGKK
jgi:hypothetical protein